MKVHKIVCPECSSSLTSKAGIEEGTSINCPKCKNKFTVAAAEEEVIEDFDVIDDEDETPKKPAAKAGLKPLSKQKPAERDDDEEEEEEEKPKAKPAAKSTLKPLSKRKSDDDEDERPGKSSKAFDDQDDDKPARKKKAVEDDDDDDRPRAKRKNRDEDDDDDDEERPRSKRKRRVEDDDDDEPKSAYGKLKSNVYVRASVLGVLLIVLGVLGYLLYDKYSKKKDDTTVEKKDDEDNKQGQAATNIPPPPNTAKKNDPIEQARFQGKWKAVLATRDGVDAPAEELASMAIEFRGDQAFTSDKPNDPVTLRINATVNPAQFELVIKPNEMIRGIFRFVGMNTGILEVCMNPERNGPRPTGFGTKGSPHTFVRLQREK